MKVTHQSPICSGRSHDWIRKLGTKLGTVTNGMKIRRKLLPFFILREGTPLPRTKRSNPPGGKGFVNSGGTATPRRGDGCAWQAAACHIFFPKAYLRANFMPFGTVTGLWQSRRTGGPALAAVGSGSAPSPRLWRLRIGV